MSERGYFEQRWAFPGYAFLLVLALVNYNPVYQAALRVPDLGIFAALIGFLTLSGPPLGYIVSQPFWLWLNRNGGITGLMNRAKMNELLKGCGCNLRLESIGERRVFGVISDFSIYSVFWTI